MKLSNHQRDELLHLQDIAEGEYKQDGEPEWKRRNTTLLKLLNSQPLTEAETTLAVWEIEWHIDKSLSSNGACTFPEDAGHVRSMRQLQNKIDADPNHNQKDETA